MAAFQDRFFTSRDGLKLYAREYPGPSAARLTVVCIPGLTRNSRDFEDFAAHLAQTYRVFCPELRGRARSEYATDYTTYQPATYVRDILTMLDAFNLPQVAFVGTSLGGIISMIIGAVAATRVLGIVTNDIGIEVDQSGISRIVGYVARGYSGPSWEAAAEALRTLDGKIFPTYTQADWIRMAKRRFVAAPDGTIVHDYDINIAKTFGNASQAQSNAGALRPFFKQLGGVPLLALRGAISDVLTQETFDEMKRLQPHMIQCLVPNRGHTPYLDEPEALAAIDPFLASLPSSLSVGEKVRRGLRQTAFLVGYKLGMMR